MPSLMLTGLPNKTINLPIGCEEMHAHTVIVSIGITCNSIWHLVQQPFELCIRTASIVTPRLFKRLGPQVKVS